MRDARWAHGFHRVRVLEVLAETADSRTFVLDIPPDLAGLFSYRAGQFCTFRVTTGKGRFLRSYSMSSAPEVDRHLAVTVKRVPGGAVSGWMIDSLRPGAEIECTPPAGVFCLSDRDTPVVAYCGGSGITPVMSIAKSALAATGRPVRLLYANRSPASVIFGAALEAMERSHPGRFTVTHHLDSAGGLLTPDRVAGVASTVPEGDFYICGPAPFMDLVESTLLGVGIDPARIFIERFEVDGGGVPAAGGPEAGHDGAAVGAGGEGATPGSCVPGEVTIVLEGKRSIVPYRAGDTILETARRAGMSPPFSCEAGNCATCMALLKEGSVSMRVNNALSPEEVEEGWVLTCQSVPTGRGVVVEYAL